MVVGPPVCLALASTLCAQELEPYPSEGAPIELTDEGPAKVKIGAEHVEPGELRFPARAAIGGQGVLVEFSLTPEPKGVQGRSPPPRLSDLIGNPQRQAALDEAAKPGDWVVPPAAKR